MIGITMDLLEAYMYPPEKIIVEVVKMQRERARSQEGMPTKGSLQEERKQQP